jgi:glucuronate isomerase
VPRDPSPPDQLPPERLPPERLPPERLPLERLHPVGLHPDRLFPAEPAVRSLARALFEGIADLPLVAVHGHVDPGMLLADEPFADPSSLLVSADHYVLRILHAVGVPLGDVGRGEGGRDPRAIWRIFCARWPAFRGTATRLWLEHELVELFGVELPLSARTADASYDVIASCLARPEYRPRALYARFGLEVLSTTDGADADFAAHRALQAAGLAVVPTVRPDALTDPTRGDWRATVDRCGLASCADLVAYVAAARRRSVAVGAVATDHGHRWPGAEDLGPREAEVLFARLRREGEPDAGEAERLARHLLLQMAVLALDDGLALQLHPGVQRNHDRPTVARFGPDSGSDFPVPVNFTSALRPILERFGNEPGFRLVVFTVDETAYSRELAPMASYYPGLYLGAPWWFLDAPDAMARHFAATAESAGYAKLSGFVDDTRAFCSIPARHDVARRSIAAHLARLVAEHRLTFDDAAAVARDYAYDQPRSVYRRP